MAPSPARAALAGGAERLAVATARRPRSCARAGVDAPGCLMGAISAEELPFALDADADLVAWSERFVDAVAAAASAPVESTSSSTPAWGGSAPAIARQALAVAPGVSSRDPRSSWSAR